jgi:transposase
MLRATYTDDERTTFDQQRFQYPDPRIQRRFEILWLHAHGKFAPEISTLVKRDRRTVRNVIKNYQEGGIDLVTKLESNHPTSELAKHKTSLIEEFTLRPPASGKEAAFRIETLTGHKRSPERVRVFMHCIGMKFRKVGAIPAKADLDKQEDFKKKLWSLK